MPEIHHSFLGYSVWLLRWIHLNLHFRNRVAWDSYIALSAKLQRNSDGYGNGGSIQIEPGARISDGVILAPYGGSIFIGKNVYIGPYCVLYGHGGLTIGHNTLIAAHTVIIPANHGFSDVTLPMNQQPLSKRGIEIGEDVWIGCGVRVLDGVKIGRGSIVGAGSVVNKSLDEYSIAVGIPAKAFKSRNEVRQ